MNGLVCFISKYGAARQYAEWISHELGFSLVDISGDAAVDIASQDCVVVGGSVYAGRMKAARWLVANHAALKGKKICYFSVGGMSRNATPQIEEMWKGNIPDEVRGQLKLFHFEGRIRYAGMKIVDKLIVGMIRFVVKDKKKAEEMVGERDKVSKDQIAELVAFVRQT